MQAPGTRIKKAGPTAEDEARLGELESRIVTIMGELDELRPEFERLTLRGPRDDDSGSF